MLFYQTKRKDISQMFTNVIISLVKSFSIRLLLDNQVFTESSKIRLVSLFNGIATFLGYLMPKLSF